MTLFLSFRMTIFHATSTVSGQNSFLLFLERRWLFSYLEILGRQSCPSQSTEGKRISRKTCLPEFGPFLLTHALYASKAELVKRNL